MTRLLAIALLLLACSCSLDNGYPEHPWPYAPETQPSDYGDHDYIWAHRLFPQ